MFCSLRRWWYCCSVNKSCPTLCDPMSTIPDFPVLHYLLAFAQTPIHWVSDAIQPSPPLSPSSLPALNLFQWTGSLHQVAKVLELQHQHQSFQWIFRFDFLSDWLVWCPCSPRDSQESSPALHFKSIHSSALSLLYGPTLISIHDYWAKHSYDYVDLCHKVMFLLFSWLVIAFLPRNECLLISWLQSPSAVILEPKKIKCTSVSTFALLFAIKWWGWMPWSSFFEYWVSGQLFHSPLSHSSKGSLVPLLFQP